MSERFFGYVYETYCRTSDKFYIGLKFGEFNRHYFGSGHAVRQALKKYGVEQFEVQVLGRAHSREALSAMEKMLIADYRKKYGAERVYNISSGGFDFATGMIVSEENRAKASARCRNRIWTSEMREKLSRTLTGRKQNPRSAETIAVFRLGHRLQAEFRKLNSALENRHESRYILSREPESLK